MHPLVAAMETVPREEFVFRWIRDNRFAFREQVNVQSVWVQSVLGVMQTLNALRGSVSFRGRNKEEAAVCDHAPVRLVSAVSCWRLGALPFVSQGVVEMVIDAIIRSIVRERFVFISPPSRFAVGPAAALINAPRVGPVQ